MILVYHLFIIIMCFSSHGAYSAQAAASLSPSYMQQYAHCSGIVYRIFADTITTLTPEQAAQMVHGPQHFLTAQVLGTAFIESLRQQRAEHTVLDQATIANAVAPVHAETLKALTAAGQAQGLATRADMLQLTEEMKKMREELEKVKNELAKNASDDDTKNKKESVATTSNFSWLRTKARPYDSTEARTKRLAELEELAQIKLKLAEKESDALKKKDAATSRSSWWFGWMDSAISRYNFDVTPATTQTSSSASSAAATTHNNSETQSTNATISLMESVFGKGSSMSRSERKKFLAEHSAASS